MSLIQILDCMFGYEGSAENVFDNLSLSLDTSWKLGLVGRNGKGKTTLLRLLAGHFAYQGKILSDRKLEYFPYSIENPEDKVLSILLALLPDRAEWEIRRELSMIGLSENVPECIFSALSQGEQTKVLLTALFLKDNSFPLIDEPTNHLDSESRKTVSAYLGRKEGFLLVSHDRDFLDGCIDHVLALNREGMDLQKGNYSSWFENKERQDAFEAATNEKLKKSVEKLERSARQAAGWAEQTDKTKKGPKNSGLRSDRGYIGHQAAKMMSRSKSIERRKTAAAEEARNLLKNIEETERLILSPQPFHSETLLAFRDCSVSFDGRKILDSFSFSVHQGERIALCGKNGCGKSTLLKIINGEKHFHTGEIFLPELVISYLPQDISFLSGSFSEYLLTSQIDRTLFFSILRKLDFPRSSFEKRLEKLSDGQKKKVLIASSLCRPAHLYLWDEPLNYLDVFSRIQLENLLAESSPTMVFVEHDHAFVSRAATRIVAMDC